ncbi:MAG TPA: hypothetical protein VLH61_11950 [Bacteroidales bacterium]|nr:hypothetical protein [Bacteroidales bacterium]
MLKIPTYVNRVILLGIIAMALASFPAIAQTRITSPYSRFGVGELMFNQTFRNLGLGGIGVAYRSNLTINNLNPASYTATDSTSFIFEATLLSHFYQHQTVAKSQIGNFTSLGNLSFSFPLTRWWGVGMGLKPFSAMGYKVSNNLIDEQFGVVNFIYEGSGGINQLFIGNAFSVFKGLSVGINASYLFGSLDRSASVSSDSIGFFLANQIKSQRVNDWHFGFGAQYEHRISPESYLNIGVIFAPETTIKTLESEMIRTRLPGFTIYDTTSYVERVGGHMNMPAYFGVGVFARLNEHWAGGFDFIWQNWENFNVNNTPGNLINTNQYAVGVKFRPTLQAFGGLWNRLEYRAGFRYGQTYLNLNNYPIDEFGISFGLHIPIRRTNNGINLGFEFGQRGTTEHNLIKENIYRINFGVNIYERWFIRRRFF